MHTHTRISNTGLFMQTIEHSMEKSWKEPNAISYVHNKAVDKLSLIQHIFCVFVCVCEFKHERLNNFSYWLLRFLQFFSRCPRNPTTWVINDRSSIWDFVVGIFFHFLSLSRSKYKAYGFTFALASNFILDSSIKRRHCLMIRELFFCSCVALVILALCRRRFHTACELRSVFT